LRALLASFPDVQIAAVVGDPAETLDATRRLAPDVVLLGMTSAGRDVLRLTSLLAEASFPVVVTGLDDELRHPALDAGAAAFATMDDPPATFLAALRDVAGRSRSGRDTDPMTPGTSPPENAPTGSAE
jgi:DNA-binding NarL/FixJ family response regulator